MGSNKLEALLAALVAELPNGIIIMDLNGRVIYVNKYMEQLSGYSCRELEGKSSGVLYGGDNAEEIQREITASLRDNRQWCGKLLQKRKGGSAYRAELEIFPLRDQKGMPLAWAIIQRDIGALSESEERYQELFNSSSDMVFMHGLDERGIMTGFIEVNKVACDRLGYTKDELLKLTPSDISTCCCGQDNEAAMGEELLAQRHAIIEGELLTKDGTRIPVEVNAYLSRYNGKPAVLSIARDVSQYRRMQEDIRAERQEKSVILSAISEVVVYHDTNMRIIWANKAAVDSGGGLSRDVVGNHCYEIWNRRQSPCPGCPVARTLKTGLIQRGEMTAPNGRVWFVRSYPVQKEAGQIIGAVEIARDITEEKELQLEMARLERLNLVGEMAAAIGHEVRNPLATVRGFLQLLKGKCRSGEYENYYNLMIEELDRANSIITEFLSLAKNKSLEKEKLNLNDIIRNFTPLIQAQAYETSKLLATELKDIPDLLLDRKEIYQLILNLANNALEAMSAGGQLAIKTYRDGDEIILAVQDQGSGIEPGILKGLGTPFVTTKVKGTGLGLAVCYRIAQNHNARIDVETGCSGATFYVRFPGNAE